MKTPSRFSAMVLRCLGLILLPLLLLGCQASRSPSWDQLVDRHVYPTSHLVEVDGVEVHLQDEGEGPVILLLHEASASLHTRDPWVQSLRGDFRVPSVDLPPSGLTGPHPDDRYDPQAYLSLLDGILDLASVDELRRREPDWVGDVEVPTLVLWGEADTFTPVVLAERSKEDLPHMELVILEGVGHPDTFCDALAKNLPSNAARQIREKHAT